MDAWRQRLHEARERDDALRAIEYKYECAMRAWHAGYGPHPERDPRTPDRLAAYRPHP